MPEGKSLFAFRPIGIEVVRRLYLAFRVVQECLRDRLTHSQDREVRARRSAEVMGPDVGEPMVTMSSARTFNASPGLNRGTEDQLVGIRRLLIGHLLQSSEDGGYLCVIEPAVPPASRNRDLDPKPGIDRHPRHVCDAILEGAGQNLLDMTHHLGSGVRDLCRRLPDLLVRRQR